MNCPTANLKRLKDIAKMSGGYFLPTAINNALPFLFLPILTRYLMPQDYANVSLFVTYVAVASSLSAPALIAFISNFFFDRPREYVARLIGGSLIVVGIFSLGILCLVTLLYFVFPGLLGLPLGWLLLVPATAFTYSLFQVTLGVIRNQKKVLVFGCHQVANTLLNFVASVVFVAVLLLGWKGRAFGIMIANALSAGMSVWYLARNGLLSLALDRGMNNDMFRFALTLMADSSYSLVVSQLGFLLMQYYFGKELLGVYSVGYNIANAVMILATTLNLSLAPFLFERLSAPSSMNRRYIVQVLYANVVVLLLGGLLVSIFSGAVLRLMTTPAYYPSRQFIPWLAAGLMFVGGAIFVKPILIKYGQQRYIGLVAIADIALLLVLSYAFAKWFGYQGIAYAFSVSTLMLLLMLLIKAQAVLPLPWLKALLPASGPGA